MGFTVVNSKNLHLIEIIGFPLEFKPESLIRLTQDLEMRPESKTKEQKATTQMLSFS